MKQVRRTASLVQVNCAQANVNTTITETKGAETLIEAADGCSAGEHAIERGIKQVEQRTYAFPPPNCFVAGTPVVRADGSTQTIEKIHIGDAVLAGLYPLGTEIEGRVSISLSAGKDYYADSAT